MVTIMKINTGDKLIGINPYTNKNEIYEYVGVNKSKWLNQDYKPDWKRILKNENGDTMIVSEEWIKRWKLRKLE